MPHRDETSKISGIVIPVGDDRAGKERIKEDNKEQTMTLDEYSKELKQYGGCMEGYEAYCQGIADSLKETATTTNYIEGNPNPVLQEIMENRFNQEEYLNQVKFEVYYDLEKFNKELQKLGGNLGDYVNYCKAIKEGSEFIHKDSNGQYGKANVDLNELLNDTNIQTKYIAQILLID